MSKTKTPKRRQRPPVRVQPVVRRVPVIPTTVRKGQTLVCMGYRCVVAGFMKPCFVRLRGKWGFAKGHTFENLVGLSAKDFAAYRVRLPFPGEFSRRQRNE